MLRLNATRFSISLVIFREMMMIKKKKKKRRMEMRIRTIKSQILKINLQTSSNKQNNSKKTSSHLH